MKVIPYLSFSGDCEAAFKFYEQATGAKIGEIHRYGGSPMSGMVPPEWGDKVINATLTLGEGTVMGSDTTPERFRPMQGISVTLDLTDTAEAERIYAALSEGAKSVMMPLQETYWAARFGMFTDRFGTPWMINCSKPM